MKNILIYIALFAGGLFLTSCIDDDLNPQSQIFDSVNVETDFDKWLEQNYRAPYNIRFLYRMEDMEAPKGHDLVPADELYCKILAKMLRYLWIDVYAEAAGNDFMREHAPRTFQIVGSGAYNDNNTINLGYAEGGLKITLYVCNWLKTSGWVEVTFNNGVDETDGYDVEVKDIDNINGYFLHFIHHEFAHILHQKIMYPLEFQTISAGKYVSVWTNYSINDARKDGFVSSYGAGSANEDFVETFSIYLSSSDEEWESILSQARADGATGDVIINKKLDIVRSYFKTAWNIDLEGMRDIMKRRYADVSKLDWDNFKTEE